MQAYRDAVRAGFKTQAQIVAESGGDIEDLLIARPGERGFNAGSDLQVRMWRGLLDKLEQELKY